MNPWGGTPAEEMRALRVAAARAGCRVVSLAVRQTAHGPRAVGEMICPDGWGAARMLLAAAIEDSKTAGARDLALTLRRNAPTDAEYARAVQQFVKDRVRFVRESGEVFTGPAYTLEAGGGDCDDHARLVIALGLAGGLPAQLGILHRGSDAPPQDRGPAHAVGILCADRQCSWAETTVDAAFGEHPLAAAQRLGLLRTRDDLAKEQVIMTENDLGPIPPDYLAKNPPEKVALDTDALIKLGYLAALPSDPADPTNVDFRRALLAFQLAMGITPDGLIGPQSRASIAAKLPPADHFTSEYMGSIGAVTGPTVRLTSHLDDAFFAGVADLARFYRSKGSGVTGLDFLAVWLGESGVHANVGLRTIIDKRTGKTITIERGGLNGMGPVERANAGFHGTYDDWIAMTASEQLPYVRKFYEQDGAGRYAEVTDGPALELLNFLPAFLGHHDDPNFVLARQGEANGWYDANPLLDLDDNGRVGTKHLIEVADMKRWIDKNIRNNAAYWAELSARMAAAGDVPPPGVGVASAGLLVLLVAGIGTAVADMLGKL